MTLNRNALLDALIGDQAGPSTADVNAILGSTVKQRGSLLPLVQYEDNSVGVGMPEWLNAPVTSLGNMLSPGYFDFMTAPEGTPQAEQGMRNAIMDSTNVAGAAVGGGTAFPKPTNSLGIFGGRLAKTADHAALAKAEGMAAKGASREDIWNETGWFQGADGKWRFEIDDSTATVRKGRGIGFSGAFNHPGMSENYPYSFTTYKINDSANVPIHEGSYNPLTKSIKAVGQDNENARIAALHETQHRVQSAEGFGRGTNLYPPGVRKWPEYKQEYDAAIERDRRIWPDEPVDKYGAETTALVRLYRRNSGETEARAVESRRDLTPEQRRARYPWLDYDVPEDQQIVRYK